MSPTLPPRLGRLARLGEAEDVGRERRKRQAGAEPLHGRRTRPGALRAHLAYARASAAALHCVQTYPKKRLSG